MDLLTQNSKMKKSSQNGITNVNWTIPAFMSQSGIKTCPNAGLCAVGCYARQGAYQFGNVKAAHEAKLALTQIDTFVGMMIADVQRWLNKRNTKRLVVRIHDAGLCAVGCYARQGAYQFGNVKAAHEAKLALTQIDTFVGMMIADVQRWLNKRNTKRLQSSCQRM